MSKLDHSDLDGHLLEVLVAVIEESSVTRAAQWLEVTQSAVSHLLGKLRAIVADPLFVRSGRGIVATARAEALAQRARMLLVEMRAFAASGAFEPAQFNATVTIAANDLQRDLLQPLLLRTARVCAPGLVLRVMPSAVPSAETLREELCQLVITPRPPDASDIVQQRLFEDRYLVFHEASARDAPRNEADYLASEHVTVLYERRRALDIDRWIDERGLRRRFAVTVPDFSGVGPFLRASALLTTLPGLVRANLMRGFSVAPVPFDCPPMPMYMVWHLRHHTDPMHLWLRSELQSIVAPALAAAEVQPTRRS